MRALAIAAMAMLAVAPTGPATRLVAIWMDHGSPYMELRPDGSGRIGQLENSWTAEKDAIHITQKESGDTFDLPYVLEGGGKSLKIQVNGLPVVLERSKQKPAAKAPPPPKPPSQIDAKDAPDAGVKEKKKGKGKK